MIKHILFTTHNDDGHYEHAFEINLPFRLNVGDHIYPSNIFFDKIKTLDDDLRDWFKGKWIVSAIEIDINADGIEIFADINPIT